MIRVHKPETVTIGQLRRAGYNPRTISREEMESLRASLTTYGLVQNLVAQRGSYLLVGGHQRLDAMVALLAEDGLSPEEINLFEVQVTLLDITDEEAKALNLALNRISGEWDHDKLTALLTEINASQTGAELPTGFTSAEVEDLLALQSFGAAEELSAEEQAKRDETLNDDLAARALKFTFQLETHEAADRFRRMLGRFGGATAKALPGALDSAMRALEDLLPPEAPAASITSGKPPRKRGKRAA